MNTVRQKHIEQLAAELGCRIVQAPNMPGMMFAEASPPYIEIPTIENQIHYLTGLHETAHVFFQHTQARSPETVNIHRFYFDNGVLHSEAQAWEWALDHCSEPIEPASRVFMWETCLGSYYADSVAKQGAPARLYNGNRHHVEFIYDKPDDYFWGVVKRIKGE